MISIPIFSAAALSCLHTILMQKFFCPCDHFLSVENWKNEAEKCANSFFWDLGLTIFSRKGWQTFLFQCQLSVRIGTWIWQVSVWNKIAILHFIVGSGLWWFCSSRLRFYVPRIVMKYLLDLLLIFSFVVPVFKEFRDLTWIYSLK